MANGYPLAAVVGDRDVMDAARKTWISSTLASEASALAAAGAVLDWHDSADVCESLWSIGADMRRAVARGDRRERHRRRLDRRASIPCGCFASIDPSANGGFSSWRRSMACCSSAARTTIAALAHDDDAFREIEAGASAAFVELRDEEAAQ